MTPSVFTKTLEEITPEDIAALVSERYPENDIAEFKGRLPHKDGLKHPWYSGAAEIGDKARNEILAEVIAFANARGGHVLLGIKEGDEHPRHAVDVEPIPRCAELAERLKMQLRDCVEPQIPLVRVRGIPTKPDGSGVVIIRVPESRSAPHRLTPTRECYFRRADSSEKMTMRDIQDLTLRINRGLDEMDAKYKKRSSEFRVRLEKKGAVGIRATVIPVTPLFLDRVYGNVQAFPSWRPFKLTIGSAHHEIPAPIGSNQRPILRGAQYGLENKHGSAIAHAYTDGLVEMCSMWFAQPRELIYITRVLGPVANALLMAEHFRNAAGVPDIEYGLEVELYDSIATSIALGPFTQHFASEGSLGSPLDSPCILPRYSFGPLVEITPLIELVVRDLIDAAGTHAPKGPYVLSW